MRKYTKPEAELEKFLAVDVVTTSTDPEPPVVEEYMWYGKLTWEEAGSTLIQYSDMSAEMIKTGKHLTQTEPSTLFRFSLGKQSTTKMGDYMIVIVPKSKNYIVTQDNSLGGKVEFQTELSGANGIPIIIDGIAYELYGNVLPSPGETYIYIDEK